jgi:thiol:disulfide interchange protein DsbD
MSLLPEISNPYIAAFAFGLIYGIVFCTSSCLPYVASYIAGIGANFRKGVLVTFIFNSGRVIAYAIIGGVIGLFKLMMDSQILSSFQRYSSFAFAFVTIGVGTNVLFKTKSISKQCDGCNAPKVINSAIGSLNAKFDLHAFSLGLSRGLIVCPPLLLLLVTYSAAFTTALDSVAMAMLFGVGTALSPILLLGGVTGWLLSKAPLFKKWISLLGGVLLILLGLIALLSMLASG